MKFKTLRTLFLCLCAYCFLAACGTDEENDLTLYDAQRTTTGEIVLDEGIATANSPVVVRAGESANVQMSLPCSYADPNGTTFSAEPKANVRIMMESDTAKVETLSNLTKIEQVKNETTNSTYGETTTYTTDQIFRVGPVTVRFGMSYETIQHVNSEKRTVSMPYLLLSSAREGTASSEQTTRAIAQPVLTSIRLVPLADTRGTMTTEQPYKVYANFTVDAQTIKGTEVASTRPLSFEASFTAIVCTTTEYPDPETSFAYKLLPIEGTSSANSPFTLTSGSKSMTIGVEQTVTYSWFDTESLEQRVRQFQPEAQVSLTLEADTAFALNDSILTAVTALEPVINSEGENPKVYQAERSFEVGGGQKINFKWCYDVYSTLEVENNELTLPYMELTAPELVSVNLVEKPDIPVPNNGEGMVYEVSLKFAQDLMIQNTSENTTKRVEYIVKYMAVQEVKLVKVVYRKDIIWHEPHDNMLLWHNACVYRDRIYSDGKTFTDTFVNTGRFVTPIPSVCSSWDKYDTTIIEFGHKFVASEIIDEEFDSGLILTRSVGVEDLSLAGEVYFRSEDYFEPAGNFSEYKPDKNYEGKDVSLKDVEIIGADSTSSLPSGWYWAMAEKRRYYAVEYYIVEEDYKFPFIMVIRLGVCDQYLVIDGQMITFMDMREEPVFTTKDEAVTMPNGAPARVITIDGRQRVYDREIFATGIMTVYQMTPDQQSAPAAYNIGSPNIETPHAPLRPASSDLNIPRLTPKVTRQGKVGYGTEYTETTDWRNTINQ